MIIQFKGRSSLKQFNKNKPHKWGIKLFAIVSANGFVHDFEVYIGKRTLSDSKLGISGDIVIKLASAVPNNKNHKILL